MLQASVCPVCGHRYRTHFVEPPVERTEAFTLMAVPPVAAPRPPRLDGAARTARLAFASSFLLVALAGGLLFFVWNMRQPAPQAASVQTRPADDLGAEDREAVRLFQTIGPMMSLYDLDKAAGGTGRVVRASDPHLLLIFYDYPHHSVHVFLSRTDLDSGDYQVQAVALYQGKTLIQRHAEVE